MNLRMSNKTLYLACCVLDKVLKCRHLKKSSSLFSVNHARLGTSLVRTNNNKNACEEDDEFEYMHPICEESYEPVLQHLRCNFFPDEVMNRAVGLVKEGEQHDLLEMYCIKTMKDNLSVMAINTSSDEIAAVCLNAILKIGDLQKMLEFLETVSDEKFKLIFTLITKLNLSCDIFNREDVDELLECRILSVDSRFRGKGVAGKLVDVSEEIGRDEGFKVMKADLTGAFSQKIFARRGFEVVLEKKYEDITDENGEQLLKTEPPHCYFKTSIKRLDD